MKPAAVNDLTEWEAAYQRFETPEQEIRKFVSRLRKLGADGWSRESQVVELFCGRGNGLHALNRLGFRDVEGVDLSPTLTAQYKGPGRVFVSDCRELPFPDASKDIAVVQGGLHHLASLQDLQKALSEIRRVLRPKARLVVVEPWLTPFLRLVHTLCGVGLVRMCSRKFDALAVMVEHERTTYEQWLAQPQAITVLLEKYFRTERRLIGWGKLAFVGQKE
jgi:ubiquinone/menaquinone biosynthesis C-methylase UbiE